MDCQNWLVVDFDGTCSIDDTTPMLPRLAALCAKELANDDTTSITSMTYEERQAKFTELEQEYFALYQKAKEECQPPPPPTDISTTTSEHQTTKRRQVISSLSQALDRMDQVSNIVTDKVSTSRVLSQLQANLEHTDFVSNILKKYPDEIKVGIRPHCGSLLRQVMTHPTPLLSDNSDNNNNSWGLAVLSINWCPSLISASLKLELEQQHQGGSGSCMPIIWSNRVDCNTGNVDLPIPGAMAKREKIASLRKDDDDDASTTRGIIVYVGDSSTDLLAILEADVGILFGGSSSTIGLAKQYGVTFKPLTERKSMEDTENSEDEPIIWTADCWSEIEAQMKGDDPTTWFR